MAKKITAFVFGIILMSAWSVNAMHCHDTSNGGHNASMTEHMDEVMGEGAAHGHDYEGHYTEGGNHMDDDHTATHTMNHEAARKAVGLYMSEKGITAYHIETMQDNDTHYRAHVHSHSGDLLDKLYIDKKSGNIHSLLEE